MKNGNLSKRMEAVVNMVSPQSFAIADVGCDHAYVSIALIERNLAKKVIAMDVRTGPLEIAKKNITAAGLESQIDVRLSDGLHNLGMDEVDTIIIAGMGGLLIKGILERERVKLTGASIAPTLILQPQSELCELRKYLYSIDYSIVEEKMLIEEEKFYTVIKAMPHSDGKALADSYEAEDWIYGRYNIEQKDDVLLAYLKKEKNTLEEIIQKLNATIEEARLQQRELSEKTIKRKEMLLFDYEVVQRAMGRY